MNNAFIKKMYIGRVIDKDDSTVAFRAVVFSTSNQLLVDGQYKDIAYSVDEEKGLCDANAKYIVLTDEKILVDCEAIFNSLLVLRNERINVIVSKDEFTDNNSDLILEGIELSNE